MLGPRRATDTTVQIIAYFIGPGRREGEGEGRSGRLDYAHAALPVRCAGPAVRVVPFRRAEDAAEWLGLPADYEPPRPAHAS